MGKWEVLSRLDWKTLIKEYFTGCGSRNNWDRLSQDDVGTELSKKRPPVLSYSLEEKKSCSHWV